MKNIPDYPSFKNLDCGMRCELENLFLLMTDGVSELSFPVLCLDAKTYNYQVSSLSSQVCVVTGENPNRNFDANQQLIQDSAIKDTQKKFFMIIGRTDDVPIDKIPQLIEELGYWKNIPQSFYDKFADIMLLRNFRVSEDRDNFDYVYDKLALAELKGKSLHKKKNLVNQFVTLYNAEVRPLTTETRCDALSILESWHKARVNPESDYESCCFALDHLLDLNLSGFVAYADGKPVAFSIGFMLSAQMFCTIYEKGIDTFKGVYQYINMMTAKNLPESVKEINREQDLGDKGLRQAKLTYHPSRFVKKYTVRQED